MSQNLMQKLLAERNAAVKDSGNLSEKVSDQMSILLIICDELQKLHDKSDRLESKIDKLLQRPVGSTFAASNNEQTIKDIPSDTEPQPEAFIPSIDTDNMSVKGAQVSVKTKTRSIGDNVSGLRDLNGDK